MRIKSKLSLRKIADEYIMIAERRDSLDYSQAIALNETAAYLIEHLGSEPFSLEQCVELLQARYEVDKEQAQKDVAALIASLMDAGVVEA